MDNPNEVKPALERKICSKNDKQKLFTRHAQEIPEMKISSHKDFTEKNGVREKNFMKWTKGAPEIRELIKKYHGYMRNGIRYDVAYKIKCVNLYKQWKIEGKCNNRWEFCIKNRLPYKSFCHWIKDYPKLIELEKKIYEKHKTHTDTMGELASGLENVPSNPPVSEELLPRAKTPELVETSCPSTSTYLSEDLSQSDWQKILEELLSETKTPELVETSCPSTSTYLSEDLSQLDWQKALEELLPKAKTPELAKTSYPSTSTYLSEDLSQSDWQKILEELLPELAKTSYPSTSTYLSEDLSQSDCQKIIEEVTQIAENSGVNEEYKTIDIQELNEMLYLLGPDINDQTDLSNINSEIIDETTMEQSITQNQKRISDQVSYALKRKLDQSAKMSNEQINPAQRSMMNQRIDSASLVKKQKTALETRIFTSDYSR